MNFSHRGQPVTILEAQLVAEAVIAKPDKDTSRWVLLAQHIGIDALVKVLDEFATEKVHVPSRESFFQALYRPIRDAKIRDMRHVTGASFLDIAKEFGVTPTRAHSIANELEHWRRKPRKKTETDTV